MPSAKRLTYGDTFTAFDPSRKPVAECAAVASVGKAAEPPKWIKPQLTRNADGAPAGDDWLHEIKYDGYRMHARLDRGKIQLVTRTGLDWSKRYRRTVEALCSLPAKTAYLDGELCALRPDGVPAFSRLQAAMDEGRTDDLVFIVFDLLYLNGKSMTALPLIERKERLRSLLARPVRGLRFSDWSRSHAVCLPTPLPRPALLRV
jgi:bifunctional non-homologous end joining protein LigD